MQLCATFNAPCSESCYHFAQKPKTARLNTIIEHTASRIALNNQLEVFLKVKQAANADFSFLNPSDDLHGYYQYLKGKSSAFKNNNANEGASANVDSDSSASGIAGLLGNYASSSDESDCNNEVKDGATTSTNATISKDVDREGCTGGGGDEDIDKKRKAERLERLRRWKESKIALDTSGSS